VTPRTIASVVTAVILVVGPGALAENPDIPNLMLKPSVNLVLSVGDVEKSKEFYGEVLGLQPMSNLNLPGGFVMTRYNVGGTEIKFLHSPAAKSGETGKPDAAIGIRRLTLFFRDPQVLAKRFHEHGLAEPKFAPEPNARGWSRALVSDPDGNELALVIPPAGTADDVFNTIELRLTVGNLEKSRRFYREFVRFVALDPEKVPAEGGEIYRFRHGNTTIELASFGPDLPKHCGRWEKARGLRYIQYIVSDLDAVSEFAKSSGQKIEQPIFPLGKLARIMFIADPDGIINEFVGLPIAAKPQPKP
jgi:catechol 2,3-dioxygenase-like lactoylglutathione lyase family enzyme